MGTFMLRKEDIRQDWYVIDATGKTLGRLSSQIALRLMGKHKPIYTPHVDGGDYVIVINAKKIKLTGKKWGQKMYYHHSGYMGGLKTVTAKQIWTKRPERLVELAVKRMLPKNKLASKMLKKLKIYAGSNHPHQAQRPLPLEIGDLR
jgi:large subunit ribosomal protein L13